MTPIITPSELEHLTDIELKSRFCDMQAYLVVPRTVEQISEALISLDNIRQAIRKRKAQGPKL
jgi:hypothetical protein